MKCKFYKNDGSVGVEQDVNLPAFEGDKGVVALRDALHFYRANYRVATAATKSRGQVSGSGKKPYRQKGTGMARHGEKRSPIWVGGGVVFGPNGRDYSVKMNRKLKRLSLARSLFDRQQENALVFMESLSVEQPKTKDFAEVLKKLDLHGTVLLVDAEFDENLILAARNLPQVFMMDAASVNAWDIAYCDHVLVSAEGLKVLLDRLAE